MCKQCLNIYLFSVFFLQECLDLIQHLREQIIERIKNEDKLRYDIEQLKQNHLSREMTFTTLGWLQSSAIQ